MSKMVHEMVMVWTSATSLLVYKTKKKLRSSGYNRDTVFYATNVYRPWALV